MLTHSKIEGFGGKRALGFLLKSELCPKRSKFCMQFCLCGSNNVLYVFSLKFASLLRYYIPEKTHFSKAILWGPFVERKTKEAFCFAKPWSQYNTHVHESPTTALLAQVAKALNGPDSSLFCHDAGSIRGGGRSNFFPVLFLYTFQNPRYLFISVSFVIESSFLIAFKGLGWICLLAGIVTSTFGAQSIDYFHNTNSELTC